MTDGTTAMLSKLAVLLDMDAEGILAQSLRGFVVEQMMQSQQRIKPTLCGTPTLPAEVRHATGSLYACP
jgi:hypothetical protein